MKAIIIIIVALAVIVGGAFALKGNHKSSVSSGSNSPSQAAANVSGGSQAPASDQSSGSTITYTNDGFSPSVLTVKAGTVITIKNDSSRELQFSSDPHPAHTDDPELNMDVLEPGQSQTLKVTVTGNHGYHNHLEPGDTGRLVVD